MKFFAAVVTVALLPCILADSTLTINTPTSLTVCEPAKISWSGGTTPYYLSIVPGGDASGTALKTFSTTNATSITWTVDISAGTEITFALVDGDGDENFSDEVDIQSGSDTSCVSSSTSASGSTGSAASTDSGSTSTSGSSSATTTASDSDSTSTSATTSSSSSTTSASSSASRSVLSYGAAGVFGFVVAALF